MSARGRTDGSGGQPRCGVAPENAARLGRPLGAETVVLSHGHDDHTRDLDAALAHLDEPTVYCHPAVWRARYRTPEDGGRYIGCGHAGLRNTVEYAESVTGGTVRTVIGGTHLVARDDAKIHALVDRLDGRPNRFGAAHCTGSTARRIPADRLPDAFDPVGVGTVFDP